MIGFFSALGTEALLEILKQSSDATAIYTGSDITIQLANDAMLTIWGKDRSVLGKPIEEALPEIKGQPFTQLLKQAWQTGETYEAKNTPATLEINGEMVTSYFDFIYRPILNDEGKVYCILHTTVDVTEKVRAWDLVKEKEEREQKINEELAAANEEYKATNEKLNDTHNRLSKVFQKLEFTENRMQELVRTTPVGLALLRGRDMLIETANPEMQTIWGYTQKTVLGRPLLEIFPMLKGQVLSDQLDLVYSSSTAISIREIVFNAYADGNIEMKYLDISLQPLLDVNRHVDAVMATIVDVTERVTARKELEARELKLQEYTEELTALNEEIQSTNEELGTLNEEYAATNDHLDAANQQITILNDLLQNQNADLRVDNQGFQKDISNLDSSNKLLEDRNRELIQLNNTILKLNDQLSDSETSFSNLIAQAPVAMMLVKGDDFIITMINISMLELIGKDISIIGKPLFEELPELKGQHAANMLIETYRKGLPHSDYSNSVKLNRGGKEDKGFFNFTYTPYMENGKVTGVIDMAMEVTPQVLAIRQKEQTILEKIALEETLRSSEQRLHSILETMAEGVGVTDASGQLIYANPMAQQILGISESTIKDRTYDDPQWQNLRLDGSLLPSEEHPMSIMFATGKPVFDHEIGVQPPDRDKFYISINAAPIFDKEGKISGGIGTFMDVTARRMITQGKDDFISIASHELKTPVTALKATLQLLQRSHEKLSGETRARLLDQSVKSLDKLSHLISDLLDTSRIEQGHLRLDKKPFVLSELFDNCCSNLGDSTKQEIIFQGDTAQMVNADNQQIGQVMINFITNAIKYAPQSEKIFVKAEKISEEEIKISVKDNGPGIPKENLIHLFERYYRTNYHGQKFTGLGLGLYISADIIKNHGGKIGVESELGNGSEFWFTLPLEKNE
ncbi:PAS domain-containing protein [Chryseobacterium fluminis]|uniref:PAS domain-containing protein n=1 Tax=Chryseobacterium fluminis TaxID=2983606 RepID=UPI0022578E46|nr:PAS domain-containing protein [Chryseobacterium sp. MMS21-Ot14]UZT97088.1 PAS domain-containing protein [Chryseobacterium sp. MMS21-Ot14]